MNIGQAIRANRERLNMTQIELAERLGVGQGTIANYETGNRRPPIDTVAAMAHVFGISVDELLEGKTVTEPPTGFIEIVEDLIKQNGITRNKMLTDLGLNRSSLVDWRKRGTIPSAETVAAIADYFGVSIEYLLGRDEIPAEKESGEVADASVSERILKLISGDERYSQKELASFIGVAPSTMNNWLWRTRDIPSGKLIPISEYFGTTVDFLLGRGEALPASAPDSAEGPLYPDYEYLRALRKRRGISQEAMASILGYSSEASCCLIESGKQAVPTQTAAAISTALGLTRDEFLDAFFPGLFQAVQSHAVQLSTDPIEAVLSVFDRKYRISLSITPSGEEMNG